MMPKMDGITLLERVKKRFPTVPFVVMTGITDESAKDAAMKGGAFSYLLKPFEREQLLEVVRIAFADRITHLAANRFPEASVESLHEDDENHGLRFIAATIGILIAIGLLAYPALDSSGYIPHLVETSITAQSNWFVGESKDCVSRPLDEKSANLMHKDVGDVTTAIRCDDGPERRVQVQFFGKLIQTENVLAMWRCTRKEDSFQCNQTAAIPSPH